ncbi:MAG: HNH endonuclease signature motif containing protein [archaeon]
MTVKKSIQNEVLSRQRNECNRCEKPLDMRAVNFDHVKPKSEGGIDKADNIQALCPNCHAKKTHEDNIRKQHEPEVKEEKTQDNPIEYGVDVDAKDLDTTVY